MSSYNLSIEDCGSLDIISEILSNKETQTSSTYITDSFDLVKGPSRPLPKGIDKSEVEPQVTSILLDRKILKDPRDSKSSELQIDSFIKDIIITNPSVISDELSECPTSLNYCKELAQPFLKTQLVDCEGNVESLEKFIQDALEDIPDYQPYFEVYEGTMDILDKVQETLATKMGTLPNITHDQNEKSSKSSSDTEKIDNPSIPRSAPAHINVVYPDEPDLPEDHTDYVSKDKELNRSTSMESVTNCIKKSVTAIKRSTSSCLNKIETVIGVRKPENPNEKPTYYAMEKLKIDISPCQNVQTETGSSLNSLKNLLNNSDEKIATFKDACKGFAGNLINNPNEKFCAMKDTCKDFAENLLSNPDEKMNTIKQTCKEYADKFYSTSKDAVTLLTSESAKFLSKSNTDLNSDNNSNEGQPKKRLRNISADSITSFLFKKAENKPVNDDSFNDRAITGTSKITYAIPPAVKIGFNKLKEDIVSAKFDKSSKYDKALPKEAVNTRPFDHPETRMPTVSAIDHTPNPPSASNVFEIIRSKIFSIFNNEPNEPAIQEPQDDNEEEDPFERFIEQ